MASLFNSLEEISDKLRGSAVAIGNFDGVHLGHAALVAHLSKIAQRHDCPILMITFDPPPVAILNPDRPRLAPLTTLERRAELLAALGVEGLLSLPTDKHLLNLTPQQFFHLILVDQLSIRAIVEGPNFRFGKDRAGDTELLDQLCADLGIDFEVASSVDDTSGMISSSRIRQLVMSGQLDRANRMLTRPYQIAGKVSSGAGRGSSIGFPTANLENLPMLVPGQGVYAGRVCLEGQTYRAAVNIGTNPTFDDHRHKVEVHILGWRDNLYNKTLACDLITKIRDVQRFNNREELLEQITNDLQLVTQVVSL